jgi:hypothetical protein
VNSAGKAQKALARGLNFLETLSSGGSLDKYLKTPTPPPPPYTETMPSSRPHTPKTKESLVETERPPRKARKKIRRQGRVKTQTGLTTITSDSESDVDDEASSLPQNHPKPKISEIAALIEETAKAFEAVGDPQDVEAYLAEDGTFSAERLNKLREHCATISNLLAAKIAPSPASASVVTITSSIPSTIARYDDLYVYKTSSKHVYVLKPMEVFRGNGRFNEVKVLGLIRRKGGIPLMYALPGWSDCTDDHPRMLDSVQWAKLVKHFTDFHGLEFDKKVWDVIHKKEPGETYRCHVELRLMLWFACRVLIKAQPHLESLAKDKPKVLLGHLYKLKKIRKKAEAEIILSKEPCKSCRKFRKWFQDYTGLTFEWKVCPSLTLDRNDEDEENPERAMIRPDVEAHKEYTQNTQKAKFEIQLGRSSTPAPESSEQEPRGTEESMSLTAKYSLVRYAKLQQRNRSNNVTPATPPTRKRKLAPSVIDVSDSEDEIYHPPTPTARKPRASSSRLETASRKATRSEGSNLDESDEISSENLERITRDKREKRKRERDSAHYPSPASTKKARRESSSETLSGS